MSGDNQDKNFYLKAQNSSAQIAEGDMSGSKSSANENRELEGSSTIVSKRQWALSRYSAYLSEYYLQLKATGVDVSELTLPVLLQSLEQATGEVIGEPFGLDREIEDDSIVQ
ncbi:MAG: hypothetical protein KDD64_01230 [Bdellovibrionales bacterium]|nr:hypothetical protein [Bdellovibrionales bacterium]